MTSRFQLEYDGYSLLCAACDELLTDARKLQCGHSFCLQCLLDHPSRRCLTCDGDTIPEDEDERKTLPLNQEVNKAVASYIRKG